MYAFFVYLSFIYRIGTEARSTVEWVSTRKKKREMAERKRWILTVQILFDYRSRCSDVQMKAQQPQCNKSKPSSYQTLRHHDPRNSPPPPPPAVVHVSKKIYKRR